MKYLYEATFADGSTFRQPADDSSELMPGNSAKYDFLVLSEQRKLETLVFRGEGHAYGVDVESGEFVIDGEAVRVGDPLPENCEWCEGDPPHGVYFRRVQRTYGDDEAVVTYCFGVNPQRGVKNFLGVK